MSVVFKPSVSFDNWLYGFPCYDSCLRERGSLTRRVFFAFWQSLCSPQDVCRRCAGCGSGLDAVIVDYPFKGFPPNEDETVFNR